MASNKIKFKMSIKEVTFEFEGDYEHGKSIQSGISKTLTGLADLQNQAMGNDISDIKRIGGNIVASAPLPPSRRMRRRSTASKNKAFAGGKEDQGDAITLPQDKGNDKGQSRQTGLSPTALIAELARNGFFTNPRTLGDIKIELHRKGFSSIKASDLSFPLIALTRKEVLQRNKDASLKQWIYTKGAKDDIG